MEKDTNSFNGILEKMALISEAIESIFPYGKGAVIFELKKNEFEFIRSFFDKTDILSRHFKVDMSGVEFMFLLDES